MYEIERMSNLSFRLMALTMALEDFFFPYIDKRVVTFGITEGMTVVDYACGPCRYTTRFARLVGPNGLVYAVDVHPLALEMARHKMEREDLPNIRPVLAQGYASGLSDGVADVTCALDVFFGVSNPTAFLSELHRITKTEGFLILDDGHQPRAETLRKLAAAGMWRVEEETKDHLKCVPL